MDKFDRIFELHNILSQRRRPVSLQSIQEKMACSESTARRVLGILRDKLGAPVEYDREHNGYYYDQSQVQLFELPGLWFNAGELHALLISYNLLDQLQPGVLSSHIRPLKQRIENILLHQHAGSPEIAKRIRIFQVAARPTDLDFFRRITSAVVTRNQMKILYHGRDRDQTTERKISPQRLVYYRSNWYLDAWCHLRKGLRTFSLDRLSPLETLPETAKDISDQALDEHYSRAYGIFAGPPEHTAILHFSPSASRWIADEHWHPDQQSKILADGGYELHIPYSDAKELVMDILKYGDDVEVIGPEALRKLVAAKLSKALDKYKNDK